MSRRKPVLELNIGFAADPGSSSFTNHVVTSNSLQALSFYGNDDADSNIPHSQVTPVDAAQSVAYGPKPSTPWQICVDENSGYTYYWNVETNQVTWEIPADYLAYEAALQQYQMAQNVSAVNEIDLSAALTSHRIAKSTQEVIANRNAINKKPSVEIKSTKITDEQIGLVPYGPTWEDDGSEDAEARKLANARKRLLSYKSDSFKRKPDESDNSSTPPPENYMSAPAAVRNESSSCKIPFVPTPDEIKEHPIFLNSTLPLNVVHNGSNLSQVTKPLVPQYVESKRPRLVAEHYSNSDDDSGKSEEEQFDDVIINRLRKKALMLRELGGDVPKEIMSVLDDSKTAKDIFAEIEKEIPADGNDDDSLVEMEIETDDEEDKPAESGNEAPKPLFPILDYVKEAEKNEAKPPPRSFSCKTKMKNIQKIKLSSRAKELIKTSLLTAKARATNFIETEDGLKPAEEVLKKENEMKIASTSISSSDVPNKVVPPQERIELPEERRRQEELKRFKSEIDSMSIAKESESPSAATTDLKSKFAYPNFVSAGKEFESKTGNLMSSAQSSQSGEHQTSSLSDASLPSENLNAPINKRDGDFVKPEPVDEKTKENMFSFHSSFVVPNSKRTKVTAEESESKKVSLVSKCEEFLQSVQKEVIESDLKRKTAAKNGEKKKDAVNDIEIDDIANAKNEEITKNLYDLNELIVEKLKFLTEGKRPVSAVQVLAIQVETLIAAWQSKALTTKYLQEWLLASAEHLKSIEEAAVPEGWQCEWDRSYGRYYYRNKITGAIQWDFPENTTSSSHKKRHHRSNERSSSRRSRTPPLVTVAECMVPPPPPIISDPQRSSSDRSTYSKHRSSSPRSKITPPLPPVPPKPETPPPPPPPPPTEMEVPPPPPPVISEHKASLVCEEEKSNSNKNSSGLHDELSSFYSDIASLEATSSQDSNDAAESVVAKVPTVPEDPSLGKAVGVAKNEEKTTKKKKKVKLDSSLSLKKKGLEGLVAKWQKVSSDI